MFNEALQCATRCHDEFRWLILLKFIAYKSKLNDVRGAHSIIFAVSSRIDCSMHDNSELKSIILFFELKMYEKAFQKKCTEFCRFRGVKVFPFPEGINQLFVLYPVFL